MDYVYVGNRCAKEMSGPLGVRRRSRAFAQPNILIEGHDWTQLCSIALSNAALPNALVG